MKDMTDREKYVLLGAVTERMDALEDNIKAASDELLTLQTLVKKIKAA